VVVLAKVDIECLKQRGQRLAGLLVLFRVV
jgi:hypothetical protein